jgi:shikimate kinase
LKNNIILIGFMGSGKTSVGRLLADRTGYYFKDTDELIVDKEGREIEEIFHTHGEDYFRNLETELLETVMDDLDKTVLSTGGGIPVRDRNVNLLRKMGHIIYLRTSTSTIIKRLAGDTSRPLLQGDNPSEKVERLLSSRVPIYERAADIIIDTDDKSKAQIVNEIRRRLNHLL